MKLLAVNLKGTATAAAAAPSALACGTSVVPYINQLSLCDCVC